MVAGKIRCLEMDALSRGALGSARKEQCGEICGGCILPATPCDLVYTAREGSSNIYIALEKSTEFQLDGTVALSSCQRTFVYLVSGVEMALPTLQRIAAGAAERC